LWLTVHV
jgi:hypothetical protein